MKIETLSCVPFIPVIVARVDGQAVAPDGIMQTTPAPEVTTVTAIVTV